MSDNRLHRTSVLCVMYVAQGIPWGFMISAVISYLAATDPSITEEQLGKASAMILLPWSFKLIWAPLIDSATIRSMGRRRPWIIGAELMMALSLLLMLTMDELTQIAPLQNFVSGVPQWVTATPVLGWLSAWALGVPVLGWMFFIHNCFSSLQDVATDALAVDVLPENEQGLVNGLMWGAKLLGKGAGAGIGGWIIAEYGFANAILAQFISLLLIMLFPLLVLERPGEKRLPWSRSSSPQLAASPIANSVRSPMLVIKDLIRGFSMRTTFVHFFFGIVCVIGWGIVEVVTKPLYTRELGWEAQVLSSWEGWAVFPQLIATIAGGFLADRYGKKVVVLLGFGLYGLIAIGFGSLSQYWGLSWFATGFLLLNPAAIAIGAVGYNAIGMQLSWTKSSATMFTMYMTVSNVGHTIGNGLIGPLREGWGFSYQETLQIAGVCMLAPLVAFVFLVNPNDVQRMKDQELESANAQA